MMIHFPCEPYGLSVACARCTWYALWVWNRTFGWTCIQMRSVPASYIYCMFLHKQDSCCAPLYVGRNLRSLYTSYHSAYGSDLSLSASQNEPWPLDSLRFHPFLL